MKLNKKLHPLVIATSLVITGMAAPMLAHAEVGYSANISSMYLWRGTDVSDSKPALSGSIDYSHESGLYGGLWISSGDTASGYEYDVTVGYAGEIGDFGYDVGYYKYTYPQTGESLGDAGDEVYLGLSYEPVEFKAYFGDETKYYTFGAGFGAFSATYGMTDNDDGADWSHIDLSYSATDNLSFTLSLPSDDGAGISEDELMVISYDIPL